MTTRSSMYIVQLYIHIKVDSSGFIVLPIYYYVSTHPGASERRVSALAALTAAFSA